MLGACVILVGVGAQNENGARACLPPTCALENPRARRPLQLHKPLRSKHDRFSDRCVARFDHYCPWVYNVVGLKNHRMFVIYLTSSLILQAIYASLAFICMCAQAGTGSIPSAGSSR